MQHLLRSGMIQAKLTVNEPGNVYEQEADRVADEVMRMPDSGEPSKPQCSCAKCSHGSGVPILRKGLRGGSCESAPSTGRDEEEEEQTAVMTKAVPGTRRSEGDEIEERLARTRGSGAPLPLRMRSDMERRFGYDLGTVRLHTSGEAARLTADLGAQAFTSGADVYFGRGQYNPEAPSGKRLLAHELTHVVQQRGGGFGQAALRRTGHADSTLIQRYSLNGFPPAKAALMHSAIATALSTMRSCGSWWARFVVPPAIRSKRYDYVPDLGACGWTFPASWYIEIGESAFDPDACCRLASTVAHEASHTEFYTEGRAQKLECDCFNCSC